MQSSARASSLALLVGLFLLLFGAACPTLKLGTVGISDGSVRATGFTLQAEVVVEELEVTTGEDKQPAAGRGVLGVHLPAGWEVRGVRLMVPGESVARRAYAAPQAAAIFADTFPGVTDTWWAFASNEQTIQTGRWRYQVEMDVVVPKRTKGGKLGLTATVLQDDMTEIPAPTEYGLVLKGKSATLTPAAAPAATGGATGDKVPAGQ